MRRRLRGLMDRVRDRRHRWRPAWTGLGAKVLSVETRHHRHDDRAGVAAGPYRAGPTVAAHGPGPDLASLVYAGEVVPGEQTAVRRIELDPDDGRPWLLWQHTLPASPLFIARADSVVVVPGAAAGVEALDLFTGERRWRIDHPSVPRDLVHLADGALLVRFADDGWLELEPASGRVRDRGDASRAPSVDAAPAPAVADELVVGDHRVRFAGGIELTPLDAGAPALCPIPGWDAIGLLHAGGTHVLALLRRRTGFETACAAVDVATLELSGLAALGAFPLATTVESFDLLDSLAVARLRRAHVDDVVFILHPRDGSLLLRLERGGARVFRAGKLCWEGRV